MLRSLPHRSRSLVVTTLAVAGLLAGCSSDEDSSPASVGPTTTADPADTCSQTTVAPEQTASFTFSHSAAGQGVENTTTGSFVHVLGVAVTAAPDNDGPTSVTITDAGGATIATLNEIEPGGTCGIDHDFAPGDFFIEDSFGNRTQFSSFADAAPASSPAESSTSMATGAGTGTLIVGGTTYQFSNGGCSPNLDPDQFVFRDPPQPGLDATYLAITVTDLDGVATRGGTHEGAVTYQLDGVIVASASDLTIQIDPDLSNGRFSGTDFATQLPITGSYTC